jgi:hypothetical protein
MAQIIHRIELAKNILGRKVDAADSIASVAHRPLFFSRPFAVTVRFVGGGTAISN